MLHRLLDVIFQYLPRLVAVLVLVPAAVMAVTIGVDRTQTVTARLWADQPPILADSPYSEEGGGETPAFHQSTLLEELLQTDSFVSQVLQSGQFGASRPTDVTAVGIDLRKNLLATPEGPHVILVTYTTSDPGQGLAMMQAVVATFEQVELTVQSGQVTVADEALNTQLQAARKDMDDAIAAANRYQAAHGSALALASDAAYQSLRTLATAKVNSYAALVQRADQADQYRNAIPTVQTAILRTMDPPAVTPWQLSLKGPATKNAGYALAGVLALELVLVYNVTRRDQRVRTTHEVVAALGLLSLGTVPDPQAQ